MALDQNINRIKFLRTTVAGRKPALADLQDGELALNMVDRVLYTRNGNNIVDVGFGLGGNVNGSINATGELASTKVVTRNPNNSAANISVDWVNDEPRLRIGGSNVGSASDFLISGSSDFERMRLTSAGAMTIPSTMTANSFVGIGSGLTQLNASMLSSGVVPAARLSGTYAIDVASASKLTTPRTINNIQFDGTSNILTPANEFVLPLDARGISKPSDFVGRRWYSTFARKSDLESGAPSTLYGDMLVTNGYGDSSGGHVNALFIPKVTSGSNRKNILHYSAAFGASAWNAPRELAYTDDDITGNSDSATRLKSSRFFSAGATQYYRVATLSIPYSGGVGIVYLNGGQGFNSLPQQSASYTLTVKRGNTATSASLVVETADTNFVNSSEFFLKYVSGENWEIWANIVQYTTFYAHTLSDKNTSIELLFDSGTATKPSPVADAYMRQFALLQSNVASATKLQNARTINGVSFDGTANIVIEDSTKLNLSGGTLTGDLVGRTPNAFTSLAAIGTGASGAPFRTGDVSLGDVGSDRYMPLIKGSNITSSGYRSNISFGMYRASNDWTNSGAYIAVGNNDNYPTEALVYKAGGVIGTTNTGGFTFKSSAKFDNPTTFASTITVEDNGSNFQKLIQMSNTTDGGYLAVGNTGSDKGYVELGTIDDADTKIYVRKRNSSNAVLATQVLMDENHNAQFVGNLTAINGLSVASSSQTAGYGIGLYSGDCGDTTRLPGYGLSFTGTATYGGYGDVIGDWATYFTMQGTKRGWVFKSGTSGTNNNVFSISTDGVVVANSGLHVNTPYGGWANNGMQIGSGDAANYTTHNLIIRSHWGIGFRDHTNSCRIVMDTRNGHLSLTGNVTAARFNGIASNVNVANGGGSTTTDAAWTGGIWAGTRSDVNFESSSTVVFSVNLADRDLFVKYVKAGTLFHMKRYGTNDKPAALTVISVSTSGSTMTVRATWAGHGQTVGSTINYDVLACTYKAVGCSYIGTAATETSTNPSGSQFSHLIRLTTSPTYPLIQTAVSANRYLSSIGSLGPIQHDSHASVCCVSMLSANLLNFNTVDNNTDSVQPVTYVAITIQDLS